MTLRRATLIILSVLAGCTYGPAEDAVSITQVVRRAEDGTALVVVRHDVFQPPTGLNTFPNGGVNRYLQRGAYVFVVDGRAGTSERLVRHAASNDEWESFTLWLAGFSPDGAVYARTTGCRKGGECHSDLVNSSPFLVSGDGVLAPVDDIPDGVSLPGESIAPMPGEVDYVRYSSDSETVTMRTDPEADFVAAFRITSDGTLRPVPTNDVPDS